MFKVSREVVCPTKEDGELLMAALDGTCQLFHRVSPKFVDMWIFDSDSIDLAQPSPCPSHTLPHLTCPSFNAARTTPDVTGIIVPGSDAARARAGKGARGLRRARVGYNKRHEQESRDCHSCWYSGRKRTCRPPPTLVMCEMLKRAYYRLWYQAKMYNVDLTCCYTPAFHL